MKTEEEIKEIKERCTKIKFKCKKNKNGLFSMILRNRHKKFALILSFYDTKEEAEAVFYKFYMVFYLYGEEKAYKELKKYIKEENRRRFSKIKCRYKELKELPNSFICENGDLYQIKRQMLLNKSAQSICKHGYKTFSLRENNKCMTKNTHRFIAKYFLDDFNENLMVDHIDRNKLNNHISNLRMVTRRENYINSFAYDNAKGYRLMNGKYQARITIFQQGFTLGTYKTKSEAIDAYKAAREKTKNISKENIAELSKYAKKMQLKAENKRKGNIS
jgi:hypothetical protein